MIYYWQGELISEAQAYDEIKSIINLKCYYPLAEFERAWAERYDNPRALQAMSDEQCDIWLSPEEREFHLARCDAEIERLRSEYKGKK